MQKKLYCMAIIIIFLMCLIQTPTKAEDISPIKVDTTTEFINQGNANLKNEILILLKDDTNKKNLQTYINDTHPIIEKYQHYFDIASNIAIWTNTNIPVIGELISNVIISSINYFYQDELTSLAQDDISKKFAQLRTSGIDIDVKIFQIAVNYYVNNAGLDFSFIVNQQQLFNQKTEVNDFIKDIIKSTDIEFKTIDNGTILPKL